MEVRQLVALCRNDAGAPGPARGAAGNGGGTRGQEPANGQWIGPLSGPDLPPADAQGRGGFEACGTGDAFSCGTRGESCGTCLRDGVMMPQYVGSGKGAYLQVSTYRYVGAGGGEFDVVEESPKCRNALCLVLLSLGLGILGAAATIGIWRVCTSRAGAAHAGDAEAAERESAAAADNSSSSLRGANLTYDCVMGYSNWEGWIHEKKEYCCKTFRRGCPNSANSSANSSGFDCKVGLERGVRGWSDEKKAWCCERREVPTGATCHHNSSNSSGGIDSADEEEGQFDCGANFLDYVKAWSERKKAFCCKHHGHACPESHGHDDAHGDHEESSDSLRYDCTAGFSVWKIGWSKGKQTWCCEHGGRGCREHERAHNATAAGAHNTSKAYDCHEHEPGSASHWSSGHQAWCCLYEGKACPPTLDMPLGLMKERK